MFKLKPALAQFIFIVFLLLAHLAGFSQITTYTIQGFDFGTFYQGSTGGTINLSTSGSRSATGDVILMNAWLASSQAIFDLETTAGTTISILNGSDITLSGSNGGTLKLSLEATDLGSPFTTTAVPPARTRLNVAGKLTIGSRATSPPGTYSGTFSITFNQE